MTCADLDFSQKVRFMDRFQDHTNSTGKPKLTSACNPHLPFNAALRCQVEFCKNPSRNGGLVIENASCENTVFTLQQEVQDRAVLFDLIKACGKAKDLHRGSSIHASLLGRGFLVKDIALNNALLSMYAKCGWLARARAMFDDLPARTVVSWNALIAASVLHELNHEALACFERMQDEGFSPNAVTFISILKACGSLGAADKGEKMYAKINEQGLLQKDIMLGTAIVDMYAKCGALSKAQAVFDKLPARNVATWTALITGYVQQGLSDEALNCFDCMQDEGLSPDAVTFICILKACGNIGAIEMGREIHIEIDRQGLLENDIVLGNVLVDMYVKCDALAEAQGVFNNLPARDVTTWTTLIAGFADSKLGEQAFDYFEQMQNEGHVPNEVTFICILKACGSVGAINLGEKIHEVVEKQGLLDKYVMLGTALVDMYLKCGMLAKAQEVFDKLPDRNVVTWNVLIAGYVQHELGDEALCYYKEMLDEGFSPDAVTLIWVLKACGSVGAVEKGIEIHNKVCKQVCVEKHAVLGTALVDMYAKCGALQRAQEVFDEVQERGVAIWNALIAGYAQVGKVKTVFDKFISMLGEGIQPSVVTYVVLFTSCSHEGLVEEGLTYFDDMISVYNVVPTSEHRTCVVDILSRAGQFDKALSFIEKAPRSDSLLLWLALMGACVKYINLKLGRWAFENAVQSDEKFTAAYVCMSNLYAASDMQEE